jgi:hypothetical protein
MLLILKLNHQSHKDKHIESPITKDFYDLKAAFTLYIINTRIWKSNGLNIGCLSSLLDHWKFD